MPQHPHEEFNFDCLSEVCNPYRSSGVAAPGEAAPGQTLVAPLHDAMVEEERPALNKVPLRSASDGETGRSPPRS